MYKAIIKYPKLSVDGRKVIVQHSEKDSELWSVEDSEFSAKVVAKELGVHFLIYDIVEKALKASILTIYPGWLLSRRSAGSVSNSLSCLGPREELYQYSIPESSLQKWDK